MTNELGTDSNGTADIPGFHCGGKKKKAVTHKEEIYKVFQVLDKDGSHYFSAAKLSQVRRN